MGKQGLFFLSVLMLCLGCTSGHFISLSSKETIVEQVLSDASSDTMYVDERVRSEVMRNDYETKIADAQNRILRAQEAIDEGKAEEGLAALDHASELLTAVEVEPEADPELYEAHSDALETLRQAYRKVWPSVAHLSPKTPLSALLGILDADTTVTEVHPSDDLLTVIQKIRMQSEIPIEYNAKVQKSIEFFQGKGKEPFRKWLNRSTKYIPMMRKIIVAEGLPEDLVYLSMIESGFKPGAYSRAHACGLWQFIASTGRLYDLQRNWWVDERRDPVKSTKAAIRYLKDLYEEFGDWYLVMAAYNCGKGRVLRAMRKAHSRDYWKLRLPRETRGYVPHFIAALIISKAPGRFGFEDVTYEPPLAFDEVSVEQIDLKVVAQCVSSTYDELKALNPELRRWCTPPQSNYLLKIPDGTKDQFLEKYALLPPQKRITWHRHRIAKGETVSTLARRYGTSQSAIISANNLRNKHRIRAGRYLLIPVPPRKADAVSRRTAHQTAPSAGIQDIYVVKKGDTLKKIARNYGLTVAKLKQWNPKARRRYIYPGDQLIVRSPKVVASSETRKKARTPSSGGTAGYRIAQGGSEKVVYRVKRGDTLIEIAQAYGVTVNMLKQWNPGARRRYIHPGDQLIIRPPKVAASSQKTKKVRGPLGEGTTQPRVVQNVSEKTAYTVKKGDSLTEIARTHGVTVAMLKQWNPRARRRYIYPGDQLRVWEPSGSSAKQLKEPRQLASSDRIQEGTDQATDQATDQGTSVYIVRKGDTLWYIAKRRGLTVEEIARWNNIDKNAKIYPGDRLTIPQY